MIDLNFWKQISLSWISIYSKEEKKAVAKAVNEYAATISKIQVGIQSPLDAILSYEEEDDDAY